MSNTFLQDTFMSFFDKTKNGKSKYENLINEAKEKEFLLNMGCSFKTYIEKVSNDIEFKKGNVSAIYELESLDVGFSKDKELIFINLLVIFVIVSFKYDEQLRQEYA